MVKWVRYTSGTFYALLVAAVTACGSAGSSATLTLDGSAYQEDCSNIVACTGIVSSAIQPFVVAGPGEDLVVECEWPDEIGQTYFVLIGDLDTNESKAGECRGAFMGSSLPQQLQPNVRLITRGDMTEPEGEAPVGEVYEPPLPWPEDD